MGGELSLTTTLCACDFSADPLPHHLTLDRRSWLNSTPATITSDTPTTAARRTTPAPLRAKPALSSTRPPLTRPVLTTTMAHRSSARPDQEQGGRKRVNSTAASATAETYTNDARKPATSYHRVLSFVSCRLLPAPWLSVPASNHLPLLPRVLPFRPLFSLNDHLAL